MLPNNYPGSTIFNVEHLKKYHRLKHPEERTTLPELRKDWTPSEEYEVEGIITHGWSPKENRLKYFVRWAGYGPQHDSWVSIPMIRNAKQTIRAYHQRIGKPETVTQRKAQLEYEASSPPTL